MAVTASRRYDRCGRAQHRERLLVIVIKSILVEI